MEKIFIFIYNFFEKKRALLFTLLIACFAILGFIASRIRLEEDISRILPKDPKIDQLNEIFQNSRFLDRLVITVSLKDSSKPAEPDSLASFASSFSSAVRNSLSEYITGIQEKADEDIALTLFSTIQDKLPLYLEPEDYKSIDSLRSPGVVKKSLASNIRILGSPAGVAMKNTIVKDPVGISFIGLKKLQQLQYDDNFELYDSYLMTRDQRNLMMFVSPRYPPSNTGKNAAFLEKLDHTIDSLTSTAFPDISCTYFGSTAVSVSNAQQLRRDAIFTQGITVLFLIVFIAVYFKRKRAPLIVLLPVAFGSLFSLAAIYFIKGNISVIALGTGSVILGIAVNYSLHVFNHQRHVGDIRQVIKDLAKPMTIGSLTTVGGFLCLQFVQSEMLKDLGLFAAFSLIGASLCSLIFLPHLLSDRSAKDGHAHISRISWIDRIANLRLEHNRYLLLSVLVLTIIFAFTAGRVSFEPDMMRMNYMSDRLRSAEKHLNEVNSYAAQSIYIVSSGGTNDQALIKSEEAMVKIKSLQEKGLVKKYSGLSALILSDTLQRQRLKAWNEYWTPEKKSSLLALLQSEGSALGFKPTAFGQFEKLLNNNYSSADSNSVSAFRKNLLDDYIIEKPGKTSVITLLKVSPEHRSQIYAAFEKQPGISVIDKQYLTGRLVEIVNADFTSIALMSSVLVFLILLLTYGRIELALVSFIPMFVTWIWILGIMGIAGIQFNIINIIISALIFGLGDDYSLFIMDGLLQEYKSGKKNLASYKSSIILSAVTTIAGLGVLIFAKHPALKSIALIAIIGILCVVLIAQLLIPFLFNFLIRNRIQKGRFPWTMAGLLKSAFSFSYFVFGSILLTILGFVFIKFNPFAGERVKLAYHFILSKFAWSLMYIMGNVKKAIINGEGEDFSKPAVIVCNHQSFLDILVTIMLHPKLVLLTNSWVWRSPVFGAVVKMADYYPVEQGAEDGIAKLADRVKNGYSIVVFPEGTRSQDGTMKRFHKGAFFLAEKLNIDILPVVIHGSGYTMSKSDFLLKDGIITLKFLPRIAPADQSFGDGYAERAKKIGRYFRGEFAALRTEIEKPAYYKEQLIYNYIYKGPVLEWYMRVKLRLEKNYQFFHDLAPKDGKILDIGCGYGFMTYMLQFAAPARTMTGIDYDEQKIATANHCFSKNDQINFAHADALSFEMDEYKAIILSDVLHYLQPAEQELLLVKCMAHITDDGTIIIRDGNKELEQRHRGTKMTELFSTRIVGFNKTSGNGLSFLSGSRIREIAESRQMECIEMDNTRFTSNIVFVLKKQQLKAHGEN